VIGMSRACEAGGWATVAEVAAERITARRLISTAVAIAALVIGAVPAHARTTPHPPAHPVAKPTAASDAADSTLVAPEVVNRIVATIDGEPVTLFELHAFADQVRQRAAGGAAGAEAQVPADDRGMLDELVLDKILHKQIQEQGVAATDQQIDAYIASIK